jgi:predicted nuclease of predicted toxin-antitoxin system
VRFLVDAQLPPQLARWLVEFGHEAEHVEAVGLRDAPDSRIWEYALRKGAVIMTKDEDFAARAARASSAPVIVWLRVGNATNPALRVWIARRAEGMVRFIEGGSRLVEVR